MTDKLEALSQPVAWIIGEESIEDFKRGYETFVVRGDVDSTEETMKLYSEGFVTALLAALEEKDKKEAWLKEQLAGLANFNPDWDMLHATQESIREHIALIKEKDAALNLEKEQSAYYERNMWYFHGLAESENQRAEAAEKESQQWSSIAEAAAQDDTDWNKLTDINNELICKLANAVIAQVTRAEAAEQRIAELEREKIALNCVINAESNRADATEQRLELVREQRDNELRRNAELEARNKELERDPTIKHMRGVEEALIHATDMVLELEQRLQQPIKLSKREIGMGCEFVSDHIVVSLAAVLAEVATAGFHINVEGE